MTEQYLKLIKEELRGTSISSLPTQRLESMIQTIRKAYSGLNSMDDVGVEIFISMMKKIMGDAENLARIRLVKTILSNATDESSIDHEAGRIVLSVLEAEKMILSPVLIRYGDKIFYVFRDECTIMDRKFKRGEIGLLSIKEIVLASLSKCGEPVIDPVYRVLISSKGSTVS